ncbi:MAG: NADH-quinone oxidoreductase subunit NuoH [bacterium]
MNSLTTWLMDLFSQSPALAGLSYPLQLMLAGSMGMIGILTLIITPYALLAIWLELKVAAHMQDRVGPMVPGGWHGWAASIVAGVKLLLKEDLIPRDADNVLFWLAPMLAFAGAFGVYAVMPWGVGLAPADLSVGVFYVVAISSLSTIALIMAGWASNNKYALLGGMRSAAQAVSFEIPLVVSLLPVIFIAGTLNLVEITEMQSGGLVDWFIFEHPPFMIINFVVFTIAAVAEVNRTPFDMPEAEQEVVGGFHVEYSGIRFGMFFLGEYAAMFAQGLIVSVLFLGGWHGAWPILGTVPTIGAAAGLIVLWIGTNGLIEYLYPDSFTELTFRSIFNGMMGFAVFIVPIFFGRGPVTLIAKGMFFIFFLLWLRWTLPRVRPDQLMHTCWKVLLPGAFLNLFAVGALMTWMP